MRILFYLHTGAIQAAQHSTGHHPHEVGDLVGFLQGPSGQGFQRALLDYLEDGILFVGLCK